MYVNHIDQLLSHAHRFSDESRWWAAKGAVSLVSRAKSTHFPPKLEMPIKMAD